MMFLFEVEINLGFKSGKFVDSVSIREEIVIDIVSLILIF